MERYYTETLNEIGIEEGEYDKIYLYTLDTGKPGGVNPYLFWALMAGCVLLLLWFIASVIGCFRKTYEKAVYIGLSEQLTKEALRYYGEEQPQMIVGYDSELDRMYQKNFQAFLDLKYNPAMKEAPEGTFLKI